MTTTTAIILALVLTNIINTCYLIKLDERVNKLDKQVWKKG